jgi:hypothetical protein
MFLPKIIVKFRCALYLYAHYTRKIWYNQHHDTQCNNYVITTLSITTLSKMTHNTESYYAECRYAEAIFSVVCDPSVNEL